MADDFTVNVDTAHDSTALDLQRRARADQDARRRAIEAELAKTSRSQDATAGGSPPAAGAPGEPPTDPEGRPLIGWDVLAAPVTGAALGIAESGDTIGDLFGFDLDLSGKVEDTVEGTVFELDTPADHIVGSLAQFALPFGAAMKGLKAVNYLQKGWQVAAAAGFAADFMAFDPKDGNLSNFINEHAGALRNPLTEALSIEEDDTALEGRMKNAIEGLGLGLIGDALIRSFRGDKALKEAVEKAQALSPEDWAKIPPAYRKGLFQAAEGIKTSRERVDILMSAREQLMALDVNDPAFLKAREYLTSKTARVVAEAAPDIADNPGNYRFHAASAKDAKRIREEGLAPGSYYAQRASETLSFAEGDDAVLFVVRADDITETAADAADVFGDEFVKAGIYQRAGNGITPVMEMPARLASKHFSDSGDALISGAMERHLRNAGELPKLSEEAANLVADAEFRAGSYGGSPLDALEARAAAARELSPLAALEKDDPGLAKMVRELIDDDATLDGLSDGNALANLIGEERAILKQRLTEWEAVRTSPEWDTLPEGVQRTIDEGVSANRRSPDAGYRLLAEEEDSVKRIANVLKNQGRGDFVPETLKRTQDGNTVRVGTSQPRKVAAKRSVLGDQARLTPEEYTRLQRAVQEGDAQGVGEILAQGTNMNYVIADDNRVRNLMAEIGRMYDEANPNRSRGWEETQQRAHKLLSDMGLSADEDPAAMNKFMDELLPDSGLPSDVKITALRTLEAATMKRAMDLTESVLNGPANSRSIAEFMQATTAALRLNDARRFLSADLARGLNAHKIPVFADGQGLQGLNLDELLREGVDPTYIARKLQASVNNPSAMTDLRKMMENPKMEALTGYWYSSLLSGPITHAVNVTSNLGVAVMRPFEDITGGVMDVAFRGDVTRMREGVEALGDLVRSVRGSWEAASKAFSMGESQLGHGITPFDSVNDVAARGPFHNLMNGKNGPIYTVARTFSTMFGLPGRLLVSEDEMFRGMNYFVHARRAARRHLRSTQPNLKGAAFDIEVEKITQDARHWAEFSNRLSVEKRAHLKAIHEGAIEEAKYNTFTNDLQYGIGKSLQTFQHNHPWFRLIMPFVRTPTNIFRFAMQRMPGVGLFQRQNRELLAAARSGNRDALRDIVGRQTLGLMVSLTAADAFSKEMITGAGPSDPGQQEQWLTTHQPYSIRVGDEWIEYRRFEPFGMQIGMLIDSLNALGELQGDDELDAAGIAAGATASIISNLSSKRYLQGLTQFIGVLSSGDPEQFKRFLLNQAGNLTPLAQLNAQTNRALFDSELRELQDISDALYSRIPKASESVTPRINMWAEPINLPPGYRYDTLAPHHNGNVTWTNGLGSLVLPFKNRSIQTTPTREWLTEIGFSLGARTRTYYGRMRDVKLTPEQRNRWIELTNHAPGSRTTMEEEIDRLRQRIQKTDLTNQAAVEKVRELIRDRKSNAEKHMLREFPDVRDKLIKKQVERKVKTISGQQKAPEVIERTRRRLAETL